MLYIYVYKRYISFETLTSCCSHLWTVKLRQGRDRSMLKTLVLFLSNKSMNNQVAKICD